jgi:hypothetical protein
VRCGVKTSLVVGWADVTDRPCTRNVGAVTERADEIRIERDELTLAHDLRTAFLHPRVCPISRCQQARLYPFAAELDVLEMQVCP